MKNSTPIIEYKKMIQMENSTIYRKIGLIVSALCLFALNAMAQVEPTFTKAFSPNTIGPGASSTLIFTITNNDATTLSGLSFTDVLPTGTTFSSQLFIAAAPQAVTNCGDDAVVSAPAGGTTISLSDGRLPPFGICTFSVTVTAPGDIDTYDNLSGTLDWGGGDPVAGAAATLTVVNTRPGFSKSFSPSTVDLGEVSTLTFTIDNSLNPDFAINLDFIDNLPSGLVVANPANASTDCTFSSPNIIANPGASTITFQDGGVSANNTCTFSIDVVSTGTGTQDNVTGDLTCSVGFSPTQLTCGKATAALYVSRGDPIHIQKSFVNDPAPPGGTVDLEFTIKNFDRDFSATSVTFSDDLDAFLTGFSPVLPLPTDPCGAGSMLNFSGGVLTLTGGTLSANGGECIFTITCNVPAGATPGIYTNTTSTVSGDVDGNPVIGNDASAPLFVEFAPVITKEFLEVGTLNPDPQVQPGDQVVLRFTIDNTDPVNTLSDVTFLDELTHPGMGLPFPVTVTLPPVPDPPCGGGSSLALAFIDTDRQGLQLTNGNIIGGSTCTFDVTVSIPSGLAPGIYTNTTGEITGTVSGAPVTGVPATDDLEVLAVPELVKEFSSASAVPGGSVDVTFTIFNSPNATGDLTDISFNDDLDNFLTGVTANLPSDPDPPCGAGSTLTEAGGILTLMGGTLIPGDECSFTVTLDIPAGATPGNYTNTTDAPVATYNGLSVTGSAASANLYIIPVTFTKEFLNDPVLPGETVDLEFVMDNTSADPVGITFFTDNLQVELPGLAATGPPSFDDCGGTMTGTTFLIYSGGTIPAMGSCTIRVEVLVPAGAASDSYLNITSSLSTSVGVVDPATDLLVVDNNLLDFTKEFTDDPAEPGDLATLEFIISNPDATRTVDAIAFSDDLDAMLSGAQVASASFNDCGGMATNGYPSNTFDYAGGSLLPMSSCTIRIEVQLPAAVVGNSFTNTTGEVTGLVNGVSPVTGGFATADLEVRTLKLSKSFDGPATAGGSAMLTFTIENLDASNAVDNIDFFDDLNAMLAGTTVQQPIVADVSGCGESAKITASGGMAMFEDGSLDPASSCSFSIKINLPCDAATGMYTNTTSQISAQGLTSPPATAVLDLTNSGPATFTAPPPATIECDESTDPSNTGDVTDENHPCCTGLDATYNDVVDLPGCNGTGTITRTWTLTACNGEVTTHVQIITVEDNTLPTVSCPPDITIDCNDDPLPNGCIAPDNGFGTADLPPLGCPFVNLPTQPFVIIDGLPPGTTIEIQTELIALSLISQGPGGGLGGETHQFDAQMQMEMIGTGDLAGFNRTIPLQLQGVMHSAPRTPGDPVQTFDTDMFQLQGALFGDPDFDFLQLIAGTGLGLPSPGQMTLTQLPSGDFNVDSFFDITYQIDFVGAPGGVLDGLGGSTQGTSRIENIEGTGIATAMDNCDPAPIVSFMDSPGTGVCPAISVITRTWKATDDCTNMSSTCDQIITIEDTTPPTISCPSDVSINCDDSTDPNVNGSLGFASGLDNCDPNPIPSYTDADDQGTGCAAHSYTITRTWTMTDHCNNPSTTCDQKITVVDNTIPTIACPPTITIECDKSTGPINTGYAVGSDNCDPNPVETFNDVSTQTNTGLCTDQSYTITRTWKATDACGNMSATCDQTIVVVDTKGPVVSCPADVTVECDASTDPADTGSATAVDNCDTSPTISSTDVSTQTGTGICTDNSYTITRTWKATDNCNNMNTCDQVITVEDTTEPVITCPAAATVECDGDWSVAALGSATATDNCSGVPVISSSDADDQTNDGSCTDHNYTITRTWTATDLCGKMSTCDQIITIVDTNGPAITCPGDVTVECDASTDPADTGEATAIDNCDANPTISSLDASTQTNNGTCTDHEYTITRTWKATDICGNMNTCAQTITVEDTTPPFVDCSDITITLDANGEWNLAPADVFEANTSFDNCGGTVTPSWISQSYFSCIDEGPNMVSVAGVDVCGNLSTCNLTVTVLEFITNIEVTATAETCAGSGNGTITMSATAGGGQLGYSIDAGANFQFTGQFTSLTPGVYNYVIRVFGIPAVCEETGTVEVLAGGAPPTWYKDLDNDGYSDYQASIVDCDQPPGYKLIGSLAGPETDCDDNDPLEKPGQVWYPDADDDGYGAEPSAPITQCLRPAGHKVAAELTELDTDCDDGDAAVNPAATEVCNGIDDDCDGDIDEGLFGFTFVGNVVFTTQAEVDAWSPCYSIIDGNLTIQGTDITDLSNLSNITEVTANLSIQQTGLTDLSGLDNLATVGGIVIIYFNSSLTSLNGLQTLSSVGGSLIMYYNFALSDCCAIQALINGGGVSGSIVIFFNASGCNSVADINNSCPSPFNAPGDQAISNEVILSTFSDKTVEVYPNPVSSILNVQFSDMIEGGGSIILKDIMGRQVAIYELVDQHHVYQFDINNLINGLYLIEIKVNDGETFVEKIVIEH